MRDCTGEATGIAKGAGARVEDLFRPEEGKIEEFRRTLAAWLLRTSNSTPFPES